MLFTNVASLHKHLKTTISTSKIEILVKETVDKYIHENVYSAYTPNSYVRTHEFEKAVIIGEEILTDEGYTFEVYIDSSRLNSVMGGVDEWGQHASVHGADVTEYIPLWLEEGTRGSLWDRNGAYYMQDSHIELSGGKLAQALAKGLRAQGYMVTVS